MARPSKLRRPGPGTFSAVLADGDIPLSSSDDASSSDDDDFVVSGDGNFFDTPRRPGGAPCLSPTVVVGVPPIPAPLGICVTSPTLARGDGSASPLIAAMHRHLHIQTPPPVSIDADAESSSSSDGVAPSTSILASPLYTTVGGGVVMQAMNMAMSTGEDNNVSVSFNGTCSMLWKVRADDPDKAENWVSLVLKECVTSIETFPVVVPREDIDDTCMDIAWTDWEQPDDAKIAISALAPAGPGEWLVMLRGMDPAHARTLQCALATSPSKALPGGALPPDRSLLRAVRTMKRTETHDTPVKQGPCLSLSVTTGEGEPVARTTGFARFLQFIMPTAVSLETVYLFVVPEDVFRNWSSTQNQTRNLNDWRKQYETGDMTPEQAAKAAAALRDMNIRTAIAVSALDLVPVPFGAHYNILNAVFSTLYDGAGTGKAEEMFPFTGKTATDIAASYVHGVVPNLLRLPTAMLPWCVHAPGIGEACVVISMIRGTAPAMSCLAPDAVDLVSRHRTDAVDVFDDFGEDDLDEVAAPPPPPPTLPEEGDDEDADVGPSGTIPFDSDDDDDDIIPEGDGVPSHGVISKTMMSAAHIRRSKAATAVVKDKASLERRVQHVLDEYSASEAGTGVVMKRAVVTNPPLVVDDAPARKGEVVITTFHLRFPSVAHVVAVGTVLHKLRGRLSVDMPALHHAAIKALGVVGALHMAALKNASLGATHWREKFTETFGWATDPAVRDLWKDKSNLPFAATEPVTDVLVLPPQAINFMSPYAAPTVAPWIMDTCAGGKLFGGDRFRVVDDAEPIRNIVDSALGGVGVPRIVVVTDPCVSPSALATAMGDTLVIAASMGAPPLTLAPWMGIAALSTGSPSLLALAETLLSDPTPACYARHALWWCKAVAGILTDDTPPTAVKELLADAEEVETAFANMSTKQELSHLVTMDSADLYTLVHDTLQKRQVHIALAFGNEALNPFRDATTAPLGKGLFPDQPFPLPTLWYLRKSSVVDAVTVDIRTTSWSCGTGWRTRTGCMFVEPAQDIICVVVPDGVNLDDAQIREEVHIGMIAGSFRRKAVAMVNVAHVEASVAKHRAARHTANQLRVDIEAGADWAVEAGATGQMPEGLDDFMCTPDSITAGVTEAVMEAIQVQREHHNTSEDAMVRNMDLARKMASRAKDLLAYLDPDAPKVKEDSIGVVDPRFPNRMGPGRGRAPFHQLLSLVMQPVEVATGRRGKPLASNIPSASGANFADRVLIANADFLAWVRSVRAVYDELLQMMASDSDAIDAEVEQLRSAGIEVYVERLRATKAGIPTIFDLTDRESDAAVPQFAAPDTWASHFIPELTAAHLSPHPVHVANSIRVGTMEAQAAEEEDVGEDADVLAAAGTVAGAGGDAGSAALMMDNPGATAVADAGVKRASGVTAIASQTAASSKFYSRAVRVVKSMRSTVEEARKYLHRVETTMTRRLSRWKRVLFSRNKPVVVVVAPTMADVPAMIAGTSAALFMYGTNRFVGRPFWDPVAGPSTYTHTRHGWADNSAKALIKPSHTPTVLAVVSMFCRGMAAIRAHKLSDPSFVMWGLTHRVTPKTGAGPARQFPDVEPPVVVAAAHIAKMQQALEPSSPEWNAVAKRATDLQHAFTVAACVMRRTRQRTAIEDSAVYRDTCEKAMTWVRYVFKVAKTSPPEQTAAAMQRAAIALQCVQSFASPPECGPDPAVDAAIMATETVAGAPVNPYTVARLLRRRAEYGLQVPLVPCAVLHVAMKPPLALNIAGMARHTQVVAVVSDADMDVLHLSTALPVVATATMDTPHLARSSVRGGAVGTHPEDGKLTPGLGAMFSRRGLDVDGHGHIVPDIITASTPSGVITARGLLPGLLRSAPELPPLLTSALEIRPRWAPVPADPRRMQVDQDGNVLRLLPSVHGLVTPKSAAVPAAAIHAICTLCSVQVMVFSLSPSSERNWWTGALQQAPVVIDSSVATAIGSANRVAPQALPAVAIASLSELQLAMMRDVNSRHIRDTPAWSAVQLMDVLPQWAPLFAAMATVLLLPTTPPTGVDTNAMMNQAMPLDVWTDMGNIREAAVFFCMCTAGVGRAVGLKDYVNLWGAPALAAFGTRLDRVKPGITAHDPTASRNCTRRALYWDPVKAPGSGGFVPATGHVATRTVNIRVWAPGALVPATVWDDVRSTSRSGGPVDVNALAATLATALDTKGAWADHKQYLVWVAAKQAGTAIVDMAVRVGFAVNEFKGMGGGCPVAYVTPMMRGDVFSAVNVGRPSPGHRGDSILLPTYSVANPKRGCTASFSVRSHASPMAFGVVFVQQVTDLAPLVDAPDQPRVRALTCEAVGTISKSLDTNGLPAEALAAARQRWNDTKTLAGVACFKALTVLAQHGLPVTGKTSLGVGSMGTPMCVFMCRF